MKANLIFSNVTQIFKKLQDRKKQNWFCDVGDLRTLLYNRGFQSSQSSLSWYRNGGTSSCCRSDDCCSLKKTGFVDAWRLIRLAPFIEKQRRGTKWVFLFSICLSGLRPRNSGRHCRGGKSWGNETLSLEIRWRSLRCRGSGGGRQLCMSSYCKARCLTWGTFVKRWFLSQAENSKMLQQRFI